MVYKTNFDASNEYISIITANKHIVGTYCDPAVACVDSYYMCAREVDVTHFIRNGKLNVTVVATPPVGQGGGWPSNATSASCRHNDKSLYVYYELIGTRGSALEDDINDVSSGQSGSDDDDHKYTTALFLGIFSGAGMVVCGLCVGAVVFAVMRQQHSPQGTRFQSFVESDMHIPVEPTAPPAMVQPQATERVHNDPSAAMSPLHLSGVLEDPPSHGAYGADKYDVVIASDVESDESDIPAVMTNMATSSTTAPVLQSTRKFSCITLNEENV